VKEYIISSMSGEDCGSLCGRVAIVTGASSGIGAAICKSLVEEGMTVVGLARRMANVETLAASLKGPGKLHAVHCDLGQPGAIKTCFDEVVRCYGPVSVCVNNAGRGGGGSLLDGDVDNWRGMMELNVMALAEMSKLSIECMRKNHIDGHVVQISSIAAHSVAPLPTIHFYCATKHAVHALTEGFRQELRGINSGIRIACISPGLVRTEILNNQLPGGSQTANKFFEQNPCLVADDIATACLQILKAPKHVEIFDIVVRPVDPSCSGGELNLDAMRQKMAL